jgi:hypothetical protein
LKTHLNGPDRGYGAIDYEIFTITRHTFVGQQSSSG